MRRRAPLGVAVLTVGLLAADEPAPVHTPLVQAAIDKRDAAVAAADRQLAREADEVQRAMRLSNLPTATDAAVVKAGADAKDRAPPADAGGPLGRRLFRDGNGVVSHWVVTPTEARHPDLTPDVGRVSREGAVGGRADGRLGRPDHGDGRRTGGQGVLARVRRATVPARPGRPPGRRRPGLTAAAAGGVASRAVCEGGGQTGDAERGERQPR